MIPILAVFKKAFFLLCLFLVTFTLCSCSNYSKTQRDYQYQKEMSEVTDDVDSIIGIRPFSLF